MERTSSRTKRSYNSTRRRAQARRNREAIIDAATRLFLDGGYASTTVATIAEDVGVSVDTIYKGFGGKAGLVRAIHDQALAGEGPVHAELRSDELQVSEPDPRVILRGFGRFSMEVAPRAAPIILLIRDAAATDPEMADLLSELDEYRLTRMTHNARTLAASGHLRDDITVEEAAEICWIYSSAQLYELLVIIRGWPLERFGGFIGDALIAALLPCDPRDSHSGSARP